MSRLWCSECDKAEHTREATHSYRWAWGEEGEVCDEHKVILEQASLRLGRTISFASFMAPPVEPPPAKPEVVLELERAVLELQHELRLRNDRIAELDVLVYELRTKLDDKGAATNPPPAQG